MLTSMTFRVSCRLVHLHHVRQKSTGTVRNTFPIVKITETRERQLQYITYMLNQRYVKRKTLPWGKSLTLHATHHSNSNDTVIFNKMFVSLCS